MTKNTTLSPQSPDVLIVGAGPTGMTAALALTRLGMRARIVDDAAQHKQHSQAGVLWPRTQEVLHALGLLQPWQERAERLSSISFFGYGRYLGDMPANLADSRFRDPLLIGQNETEELLEQACAAAGCAVERQIRATSVTQDRDAVSVTLVRCNDAGGEGSKETVTVPWLIGTDGAGSTVRSALNLPWDAHRFAGQHVYQVDAKTQWELPLEPGRAYFFLHHEGYFGCVPLPDGIHRFFISASDEREKEVSDPSLDEMAALVTRMSGYEVRLSEPRWLTGKHYQNVITDRFRIGRVLLAGDAGKAVVPLNGQGMNTGMQDAYNLAWKLAMVHKGRAREALLDTYSAERHHNAAHLVKITGDYFTHVTQPGLLQEMVVRAAGGAVIGSRTFDERYNAFASMVDISYRDISGSAVLPSRDHGTLSPGDRVPDGFIVRGDTLDTVALYSDVFAIDRLTLLLFAGDANAATTRDCWRRYRQRLAAWGGMVDSFVVIREPEVWRQVRSTDERAKVLLDFKGAVHAAYGADKGTAVLVRPDTHAGVITAIEDGDSVLKYLADLFPQSPRV